MIESMLFSLFGIVGSIAKEVLVFATKYREASFMAFMIVLLGSVAIFIPKKH
jgi:hypothetical protein